MATPQHQTQEATLSKASSKEQANGVNKEETTTFPNVNEATYDSDQPSKETTEEGDTSSCDEEIPRDFWQLVRDYINDTKFAYSCTPTLPVFFRFGNTN